MSRSHIFATLVLIGKNQITNQLSKVINRMDIDNFKKLTLEEKLSEIKYNGQILGPYERNSENGGAKVPGDIYELYDFFVYLSEDENTVVPSRRNPLPI
ncbi:MAG: hypothetical protein JWQ09_6070 [Segetibacter sp.]|nr:hypothetical protein [Segetibacter sp.]